MARILIIEDNFDNQQLVRFLLERSGHQALCAPDGRQGMELALQQVPDLILLDMGIPEIDGWQLAGQLKADPRTSGVKVIALTAHTLPGDRKKALDAGCDGYISKPLDVPSFEEEIARLLPQ